MVVKATEASAVYDLRADYDNLVLYTCYPFHSVAFRSQRYFVCAKKISGPSVNVYID
jgi:sortase A